MTSGQYYIDQGESGQERVRLLARRYDAESIACLERIAVSPGWRCLEVGPGAGTMTDWLCQRVGPGGRVVAIDLDPQNVERLSHANLEVRKADIVSHELERDTYDLIFARAVLMHIPERDVVLDKLVAGLRKGGWLLLYDADHTREAVDAGSPPDLAERFNWLRQWRLEARRRVGVDSTLGLRHPRAFRTRGLTDVTVDTTQMFAFGATDYARYTRLNDDAWLRPLARAGEFTEADLDSALAAYGDPQLGFWGPVGIFTWGRNPG